ncbi:hypothetical protein Y032_0147g2568 [Ancylostoma ceylanicum]|uniref:Uncharacterized protein n=1 Tax=Ancylostoma ceylanicum TaxID=53326 RepID=A0A016T2A5_9BILA|nr:hypothetical protein Y032_0147g2568 [Ancylostoma ceylanicum]
MKNVIVPPDVCTHRILLASLQERGPTYCSTRMDSPLGPRGRKDLESNGSDPGARSTSEDWLSEYLNTPQLHMHLLESKYLSSSENFFGENTTDEDLREQRTISNKEEYFKLRAPKWITQHILQKDVNHIPIICRPS